MHSDDRGEFTDEVHKLCAGLDKPFSAYVAEAFWDGCKNLTLRQFRLGVARALEVLEASKLPTPKRLCQLAYEAQRARDARERAAAQAQAQQVNAAQSKWQQLVSGMLFHWMVGEMRSPARSVIQNPNGPGRVPVEELDERREACRQIATEFELLDQEGQETATLEALQRTFSLTMESIPARNMLRKAAA